MVEKVEKKKVGKVENKKVEKEKVKKAKKIEINTCIDLLVSIVYRTYYFYTRPNSNFGIR